MKQTATLLLSSQNTTNRLTATKKALQYYVNWSAILPNIDNIKQKYKVRFSFVTLPQASFAEVYGLYIDFGGGYVYDQGTSMINFLGFLTPYSNHTAAAGGADSVYFYAVAKMADNVPVTIELPTNNMITVSIVNLNTGSGTTFNYEYYLTLDFEPI